jgi:hypothetical protein
MQRSLLDFLGRAKKLLMKMILLLLIISCIPKTKIDLTVGDCVIDQEMSLWKLVKVDQDHYLFTRYPLREDSPIEIIKDLSILKKTDCP